VLESAQEETKDRTRTAGKQTLKVPVVAYFDQAELAGHATHGDREIDGRCEMLGASVPGFVTFLFDLGVLEGRSLGQISVGWKRPITTSAWMSPACPGQTNPRRSDQ